MAETAPIALMCKARQIGLSHTEAAVAIKDALVEGSTNIILSASKDLSGEVLEKAKAHARILYRLGFDGARPVESNKAHLRFGNGGRVIALPANPRTARSFTGNVHFDEAAYHTDFQAIWDAAAAMSTRLSAGARRRIRVVSTPNGAQGLFYDWVSNPPKGWATQLVTIDDAIADGMHVDVAQLWELAGHDERVFAQWYRCSFLDAQLQFIPTAMADRALKWEGKLPRIIGADLFAGLDVGRTQDLTALTVVAVVDEVAWVVAVMTCRRTDFRTQRKLIADAHEMFEWQTLHVDQTGLGRGMAEELVEEYGEDEVIPVDFTNGMKAELATRALRWLRDDRVRLPRDREGQALRDEMISVRREITPAGNVCYETPRTGKGHGDRWWSLCLALKGAGEPQMQSGVGSAPLLAVA